MRKTRLLLMLLSVIGRILLPVLTIRERVLPFMPYLRPLYTNRREIRQVLREVRQINALIKH